MDAGRRRVAQNANCPILCLRRMVDAHEARAMLTRLWFPIVSATRKRSGWACSPFGRASREIWQRLISRDLAAAHLRDWRCAAVIQAIGRVSQYAGRDRSDWQACATTQQTTEYRVRALRILRRGVQTELSESRFGVACFDIDRIRIEPGIHAVRKA